MELIEFETHYTDEDLKARNEFKSRIDEYVCYLQRTELITQLTPSERTTLRDKAFTDIFGGTQTDLIHEFTDKMWETHGLALKKLKETHSEALA